MKNWMTKQLMTSSINIQFVKLITYLFQDLLPIQSIRTRKRWHLLRIIFCFLQLSLFIAYVVFFYANQTLAVYTYILIEYINIINIIILSSHKINYRANHFDSQTISNSFLLHLFVENMHYFLTCKQF